jgi:hypothetical protein
LAMTTYGKVRYQLKTPYRDFLLVVILRLNIQVIGLCLVKVSHKQVF